MEINANHLGLYFTFGDFGINESMAVFEGAIKAGVGLIEIGLPFSDALLDGPVIQASHTRALANGDVSWQTLIKKLKELKAKYPQTVFSVMGSVQVFFLEKRVQDLNFIDGILVTDLSANAALPHAFENQRVWFLSQDYVKSCENLKLPQSISMVYLTRVQGITGDNQNADQGLKESIASIKKVTNTPIWLGFGVSDKTDVENALIDGARGAIVGTKFVRDISTWFLSNAKDNETEVQWLQKVENASTAWVQSFLRS